jgi:serine/threonine protein kinase/formylglycine-generating enzyme required for sulfatase activity
MADEISPTSSTSETPPPRTTGGNGAWEPPSPAELQALMPGYTIEKLLGRGGMGAVYKGVQENLDRTVAIKILPPGVEKEDPSFAERFKNEARLMAKLMHSAVVGVFDFGSTSAGQLYIVMEYVDGTDVSQMIRSQKKLPPEHALAITAHVCDALAAAHELGIVHRDIKPANVLINMKGQVKVADFGLAKIDDPGNHGLTKTGYAMGTPDFVAPEALMLGTAVDGRADLYAVGVMLYQMLTGQIPRGAWQPASVLSPGTDPRFDQIILKAMQYDREARYQSSAELRQALDIILTVPMVQQDAPAAAVVPAAEVAQVPAQRSAAQKPPPRSAGAPTRQPASNQAGEGTRAPVPPANSKNPLFIGLGAAAVIAIGAFVMFSGKSDVAQLSKVESAPPPAPKPSALESQATAKTTPPVVASTPKVAAAPAPVLPPKTSPATSLTGAQPQPSSWLAEARKNGGKLKLWGKVNGRPLADLSNHEALLAADFREVVADDVSMIALRNDGSGGVGINYTGVPKPQVKPLHEATSLIRSSSLLARWLSATNDVRDWQNRTIAALPRTPRLTSNIFGYAHFIFDDGSGYIWDFKKHGFKGTPMAQLDRFSPVAFGDVVSLDGGIYEYFCVTEQGRVKAIRADQNDPKPSALWSTDLYHDPVDIAVLNGMALVRRRDGTVIVGKDAKLAEPPYAPPANLPPAVGIRSGRKVAAMQQTDGRWTAWGAEDALVKKIAEIGPALDLALHATDENNYFLAWIEPNNTQVTTTVAAAPSSPSPTVPTAVPAPSLPISSSSSLPPELTALDDQLKKLTAERVTAVFEADVAKLNAGYLGGLDRKIAEEKAAGHLDGVLALNAEKTLIQGVGTSLSPASRGQDGPAPCPLPTDDDQTTAVLKALRAIYRDAYAKLVAAHAANLKALTDPLAVRLQQLEADLTKKDRIADAQTVRGYREKLGGRADGPLSAAVTPQTALGGPSALPTTSVIALKDGFTNSLGMKFVPVPGTDVVMCIHETRRQDYAAYAADAASVDATWKNFLHQGLPVGHEDNHPVAGVSWDDAVAFCTWLSQKEGRAYRLPRDQEWSYAVGIGRQEKGIKNTTPELLSQQVKNHWPWGDNFPPKTKDKAGNYADTTRKEKFPAFPAFESYTDGYVSTAPVMSFTPNKIGIYDLGGNQFEWVEDWFNAAQMERTQRGASFVESSNFGLLSSYRGHSAANSQHPCNGFRVVVDLKAPAAKPAATPPAQTLTPTKPSGLSPFPLPVPKRPTEAGKLVMWRLDGAPLEGPAGVTAIPTDLTDVVDIALGQDAALALRSDGSVVSWGKPDNRMMTQKPADLTDVVDLDSGGTTAVALHASGKVSVWGSSSFDEPMPDLGPAVAIDFQSSTVLALRNDGRVFQWGESSLRKRSNLEVPAELERVIAISNAQSWSCALGDDGRLTVWGKQQEDGVYDGPANSQLPKPDRSARRVFAVQNTPCGYLVGEKGEVEYFGRQIGYVSLSNLQPKVRRISQVFCAAELSRVVFRDEKNQWHFLGQAGQGPNGISAMNVTYSEKMAQDAIQIVISHTHALAIKPKDAKEPLTISCPPRLRRKSASPTCVIQGIIPL